MVGVVGPHGSELEVNNVYPPTPSSPAVGFTVQ